jgi:hypothetical protein
VREQAAPSFFMQVFFPMIAVLPGVMTGTLSVVAATVISFIAIVLVSSYYRFQHIVQKAEDTQPEEMGVPVSDVLRVQLARYFSGCARRGTSFSLCLVHLNEPVMKVHMEGPFIKALKTAVRHDDITCVFDGQTAALLMELEPEDAVAAVTRVMDRVTEGCAELSAGMLRVGLASYPGHGLTGSVLLKVAEEALAGTDEQTPVFLPEISDPEEEDEDEAAAPRPAEEEKGSAVDGEGDEEETGSSWSERRKTAMLDELTGVLKPSACATNTKKRRSSASASTMSTIYPGSTGRRRWMTSWWGSAGSCRIMFGPPISSDAMKSTPF